MILSVMLFACGPEEGTLEAAETTWVQNLQTASSEEIPVVVEVSFDTPSEVTAWIEFGAGSPDERTTAVTSAGSEHTNPDLVGHQPSPRMGLGPQRPRAAPLSLPGFIEIWRDVQTGASRRARCQACSAALTAATMRSCVASSR